MPKNLLVEMRDILKIKDAGLQTGTITGISEQGGFLIQTSKGAEKVIFGTAEIGDTVLFKDDEIVLKLQQETTKTYYIK